MVIHTRQYLPFKRMQEMFNDVFNAPISEEGGLHYILDKLTDKAKPAYQLIKDRIQTSRKAIGSDETGMKVDGQKHWAWTWHNEDATFF